MQCAPRLCRGLLSTSAWTKVKCPRSTSLTCSREYFRRYTYQSNFVPVNDFRLFSVSSQGWSKEEDKRKDFPKNQALDARNEDDISNDVGEDNTVQVGERIKAAKHQAQHRITEKAGLKAAEQTVETIMEKTVVKVPERLAKEISAGTAETAAEHLAKVAARQAMHQENVLGKAVSKSLTRGAVEASDKAAESAAVHAAMRKSMKSGATRSAVDHAAEIAGRHATGEAATKIGTHAAKSTVEKIAESVPTAIERFLNKLRTPVKASVGAADHAAEAAARHGAERAASKIGGHAAEATAEKTLEHTSTLLGKLRTPIKSSLDAMDHVVETAGRHAAEEVSSKIGTHAAESTSERALERVPSRVAKVLEKFNIPVGMRLGRRVLIALPLLGGIFAGHICIQDYKRSLYEIQLDRPNKQAALRFRAAAFCDAIDACAHCYIFVGMTYGLNHYSILMGEYVSLGAAAASIAFAIQGELMARRRNDQRDKARTKAQI